MGMIYKRGEVFWINSGGKPIRESTGTAKQKRAERMLGPVAVLVMAPPITAPSERMKWPG